MQPGLAFDQAPPFHVPLRFFLSAPLFGVLAGLLLAGVGPDAFSSRWHPAALALTHLMTLGFGVMAMAGALLQILPVVAAAPIYRRGSAAPLVHAGLVAGTLLLAAAFLSGQAALFGASAVVLGVAVALFVGAAGYAAFRSSASGPSVPAIRAGIAALAITAVLGVMLALRRGGLGLEARPDAIHVAWGLAGWTGLLVSGIAYQVVPMFQFTRAYPSWLTRGLTPALFVLLAAWAAAAQWAPPRVAAMVGLPIAALLAAFAIVTLWLQGRRRRRTWDATVQFWRVGMLSLLAAAGLWAWLGLDPSAAAGRSTPVALGVLALAGATASVISGMLYKIVPFLAWLHLQPLATGRGQVPNMKELVSERAIAIQFAAHCAALLLLLGAALAPETFARIAGAATALAFALLEGNLAAAALRYRGTRLRLEAPAAVPSKEDALSASPFGFIHSPSHKAPRKGETKPKDQSVDSYP